MSKQKKSIEAKFVKHAHRRRFQEYVRTKGRERMTLFYVYWAMFHRSGKGNVFELDEGLFLGDLGITKNALRPARRTLLDDGWLSKETQKIDPVTRKWGTTAWTVNVEPVAHSVGDGADAPLTGDHSAGDHSAGDRSVGDTVVLHLLDAPDGASTSSGHLEKKVSTMTGQQLVSQSVSESSQADQEIGYALLTDEANKILNNIYPRHNPPYAGIARYVPELEEAAKAFTIPEWVDYFAWQRTHKPPQLVWRSLPKFLEGLAYSLNDYELHDSTECKVCNPKTNKSEAVGVRWCEACGRHHGDISSCKAEPTIFGEPIPDNFCERHRVDLIAASRMDSLVVADRLRDVYKYARSCAKCNPKDEMQQLVDSRAKAAAVGFDVEEA